MWEEIGRYTGIIVTDIVLSGDNALVIGMAAAGLSPELRGKAIFWGMVIAAGLRIVFAMIATSMLGVPGLRLFGGILLIWVCWRLYAEIRESIDAQAAEALEQADHGGYSGPPRRSLGSALFSIALADVSMSLDNVLAVAGLADGDQMKLVIGLGLAILLMAFAATLIMKLLSRYPAISWLGLVVLVYVALEMLYKGVTDPETGIGAVMNVFGGVT